MKQLGFEPGVKEGMSYHPTTHVAQHTKRKFSTQRIIALEGQFVKKLAGFRKNLPPFRYSKDSVAVLCSRHSSRFSCCEDLEPTAHSFRLCEPQDTREAARRAGPSTTAHLVLHSTLPN